MVVFKLTETAIMPSCFEKILFSFIVICIGGCCRGVTCEIAYSELVIFDWQVSFNTLLKHK